MSAPMGMLKLVRQEAIKPRRNDTRNSTITQVFPRLFRVA